MEEYERPLAELEFVAFDLETTGLSPSVSAIVEIGAIRFRLDGTELGQFGQLVDPGCLIPAAVTRIHGITAAMVRGQPPVAEALPRFLEFLGGPDTVLLAHNARFDLGFLTSALARLSLPPPTHDVVDTLAMSRRMLRGLASHRLDHVAGHLQVIPYALYRAVGSSDDAVASLSAQAAGQDRHRALPDSRLVMGVFRRLVGRMPPVPTLGSLFRTVQPRGFAAMVGLPLQMPHPPGRSRR